MKMKPIYGSHSIVIALFWYFLTLAAIGFAIYRQQSYSLDLFEFLDMNIQIVGLACVGISYICEDFWLMTKNIHTSKYSKEGSRSYYIFSKIFGVLGFIFLALFFVHKYVVK